MNIIVYWDIKEIFNFFYMKKIVKFAGFTI